MKQIRCDFFPNCGGCLYINLSEKDYQEKKLKDFSKNIAEIFNIENVDFTWIKSSSRRKITLQIDKENNLGFFKKSSNDLVKIDFCYIAKKEISNLIPYLQNLLYRFEKNLISKITITKFDNIIDVIFECKRNLNSSQANKIKDFSNNFKINISKKISNNVEPIIIHQIPRINFQNNISLILDSDIFIQATEEGLAKIIQIIVDNILQNKSKNIIDLYGGFGSYSFAVSNLIKSAMIFEGDKKMINLIEKNIQINSLKNKIKAENRDLFLYPVSFVELNQFDIAIINPPRNGALSQFKQIAKSNLKNIIYISCNIQSFLRDAKFLLANGFVIKKLFAIDQFYMGDHFEIVAIIEKNIK